MFEAVVRVIQNNVVAKREGELAAGFIVGRHGNDRQRFIVRVGIVLEQVGQGYPNERIFTGGD